MHVQSFTIQDKLKDFIAVPHLIYRNSPYYVPRPDFEVKAHLSHKNPYFDHAQVRFFVAYDDDQRPVGRLSAQVNSLSEQGEGHFGYVDALSDDILSALFDEAEKWLKSQGVTTVIGPYSLSINDESGLLIDGFDQRPRIMMNYSQPWYSKSLQDLGYAPVKKLLAYDMDLQHPLPKAALYMAKQAETIPNMTERPVDMKAFDRDIQTIVEIFNDAWSENWGFTPMTDDEIKLLAKSLKPVIQPSVARLIFVDDQPAGMIVALPDVNEALKDLNGSLFPFGVFKLLWRLKVRGIPAGRILLMGIKKKYHDGILSSALSAHLIKTLYEECKKLDMKTLELSWILEDNKPTRRLAEMCGGEVTRTYQMYSKQLGDDV